MQTGDEDFLVQKALAGDRDSFAELAERYWNRLYYWLLGLTRKEQVAEDLTQETLFKAWKGRDSFQPGCRFRVWLFAIARHCLVDHLRTTRTASPLLPAAVADPQPGPVDSAIVAEGENLLAVALGELAAHFRSAFLLWAQDDLSFAEIGQVLGITEETARWRVFKARQLLVRELGDYLDRKSP